MISILRSSLAFILTAFVFCSCASDKSIDPKEENTNSTNHYLVDSLATPETVALFDNLKLIAPDKLLFGHQFSTAYGVGWSNQFGRSDVLEVCGDYPAVYGWDVGSITNPTSRDFDLPAMANLIRQAYLRGGINTICMHLGNPATGGSAFDNSPAVSTLLPGGVNHDKYLNILNMIAEYFLTLKTSDGTYIPIIYRPYHEHNHTWSWWGANSCSPEEYIALWKMTVNYFKNEKGIHHLLYAISPQDVANQFEYLERYPGDDYVDILGLDSYNNNLSQLRNSITAVCQLAESKGKIAALTEIGLENLPDPKWFTGYLLKGVQYNNTTKKVAWALVWRNESTGHHFAPYPGHPSVPDFIEFYQNDFTIFESDLPSMYVKP